MTAQADLQAAMMAWQESRVGPTPVIEGAEPPNACLCSVSRQTKASTDPT